MSKLGIIDKSWREGVMSRDCFSKEDYLRTSQEKTSQFVYKHFNEELKVIFEELKRDANQRKHCHREVKFEVPDPFDVNKTEDTLRTFFRGLGYEVITEPRKEETDTIILTLT